MQMGSALKPRHTSSPQGFKFLFAARSSFVDHWLSTNVTGLLGCAETTQSQLLGALIPVLLRHAGEGRYQQPAGPLGHSTVGRPDSEWMWPPNSAAGAHW